MRLILLLFFMSGFSGLVYQVIWVREFGRVFGVSVYSASTITAVFLLGLGLGSLLIGRVADRIYRRHSSWPLRAYGISELAIATLGLGVAMALPGLEAVSAGISSYTMNESGWWVLSTGSHWIRFGVAIALLMPISILMGGTLTLLIRHLLTTDLSLVGWRIGALYGLNTAGAAAGAFFTDFALIPDLGIFRTQFVAIALNAIAGLAALALAQRYAPESDEHRAQAPAPALVTHRREGPQSKRALQLTAIALFCSGVGAMGMEIVWFRSLITMLGGQRAVFSMLLTVILIGIFVGSLLGGWLHRRLGRASTLYLVAQLVFLVSTLAGMAFYDARTMGIPGAEFFFTGLVKLGLAPITLLPVAERAQHIAALAGIPAVMMGFTFPLANAHVQRFGESVGSRSGALYLANTMGNVTGSLGTGLILLPGLGTAHSVTVVMSITVVGILAFYFASDRNGERDAPRQLLRPSVIAYGTIIATSLALWCMMPSNLLLHRSLPVNVEIGATAYPLYESMIQTVSEGINETLAVVDSPERGLYTNGHPMSSTVEVAQRYMRLFSHLPLLNSESPESVLVICFGVGNTIHAASLHSSVQRLEIADLSENVLRHAEWFRASNHDILRDPRVSVFVNDGRQHLRMNEPGSYDLVTLEPPPITFAGVASLYSVEFYELVRSRLKEGGYLTQWLPAYQVSADAGLAMVRAFLEVFPEGVLVSGYQDEFILIAKKGGPPILHPDRIEEGLARQEAVRLDLERVHAGTLTALVSTFAGSAQTIERASAGVDPVTDDDPIIEYPEFHPRPVNRLAPALFGVDDLESWCPDCFRADGTVIPALWEIPHLQRALGAYYRSDAFLYKRGDPGRPDLWGELPEVLASDPCAVKALLANGYHAKILAEVLHGRAGAGCRIGD